LLLELFMTPSSALEDRPTSFSSDVNVTLRTVFTKVDAASCPHSYNFHLHTQASDGRLRAVDLAQQAVDLGLRGFAITDHHTTLGYRTARDWIDHWQQNHPDQVAPHLWSGIEISAGLLGTEVHILGFDFNPEAIELVPYTLGYTPFEPDYDAERVIAAIHHAGGLAVLAHPARYKKSPALLIPEAARLGIDGVETFYCYGNPKEWVPSPEQTKVVGALAARFQLFSTCGTDTHGLDIRERL
jgi:predicted metal-dependent phosphoesterase TrpH